MPYNLLLLPLMGGFLFFYLTYVLRFYTQRLDGYKLLFFAAIAGTGLATLARLIIVVVDQTRFGAPLRHYWNLFSPFPYSATSALSFLLSPVLSGLINLLIDRERAKDIEIRRHGNSLVKLLHRAVKERSLISVTLANRKWYVGWVADSPNLRPDERYFRLLPFASGYRDNVTLETYRSISYKDVFLDHAEEADRLVMILPFDRVEIANLFNEDLYDEYFSGESSPANGTAPHSQDIATP